MIDFDFDFDFDIVVLKTRGVAGPTLQKSLHRVESTRREKRRKQERIHQTEQKRRLQRISGKHILQQALIHPHGFLRQSVPVKQKHHHREECCCQR